MRKAGAIFFLCVLAISQFGYYSYCIFQLHEAKEAAKEAILQQLPQNMLTKILQDNNTGIEWEEAGKEFQLNGEMYDVVRTSIENGKTYLHCFGDKNEDEVLVKFQAVLKNSIDNAGLPGKNNHTVKQVAPEWLLDVQDIVITNQPEVLPAHKYLFYSTALCNADRSIKYAPPDWLT